MAERLIISLDEAHETVRWLVIDAQGNRVGSVQSSTLLEAARQADGRRVTVLVPGFDTVILSARVPSRNAQKIAQALPFALEDQLAEDIEELHFAVGPRSADGEQAVAVVRHADMQRWRARIGEAGISADAMLPDFMALPALDDRWSAALEADGIRVRIAPAAGFVLDPGSAGAGLERWLDSLERERRPAGIRLETTPAMREQANALAHALHSRDLEVEITESDQPLLGRCGAALVAGETFDLLQGPYRPRSGLESEWRRWRPAAILAAVWLVLFGVQQGLDIYQMHRHEARLQQEISSLFHRAVPDVSHMEDARVQTEQRLRALRASSGGSGTFLDTLNAAGTALAGSSGMQIKALDYRDGTLQISLMAKDMQALENYKQKLSNTAGFDVQINSANAAGDGVEGQLTVREGGR